ncbi:hypothetical protein [Erythrobacter sp. Dej080120_24]|uniref:hypothetical protein n=1 Tax=Erythrobacter sp. Dej080120_24 TaxID=3024837 RepID=UPI0030C694E3
MAKNQATGCFVSRSVNQGGQPNCPGRMTQGAALGKCIAHCHGLEKISQGIDLFEGY